jgi:hypothetical protein
MCTFHMVEALHADPTFSLRKLTLSFVPIDNFTGLLDRKLSRDSHWRYLSVKCERFLYILKVVPGWSSGGDRTVMHRVHLALIAQTETK